MWHHSEILTSWLDNEAEFKVVWELGYEKNDQNVEKSPQYLLWQLFTNVRRHVKISEGTTLKLLADTSIQKTGGPSKVNRYDVGKLFEFLGTFDLDPNQWVKIEYKLALNPLFFALDFLPGIGVTGPFNSTPLVAAKIMFSLLL